MSRIILDNRESRLAEIFGDQVIVRPLDMADILIEVNIPNADATIEPIQTAVWAFERKTIADLAASMKDGRYHEQKARLLAHYPAHRITYILEGLSPVNNWCLQDAPRMTGPIATAALQGMIFNTLYRDGIHVFGTRNTEETAAFIAAFAARVAKNPTDLLASPNRGGAAATNHEAALIVQARRGKNITPDLCWRLMVSQVPGISIKLGAEITKVWPSMSAFINEMGPISRTDRIARLKSIPLLGAKKGAVIHDFIFHGPEVEV
jgi:ERCC4-type nuclease